MTAARAEKSAAEKMQELRERQERKKQGLLVPAPSAPLAVARELLKKWTDPKGRILLRKWRSDFYRFVGPEWVIFDPEALRKWIYEQLEHATYEKTDKSGETEEISWCPDKGKVDKVVDAMTVPSLVPTELDAPAWLTTGKSAAGLVPCRNALVDVNTQGLQDPTPDYFGTTAIPFDFEPNVEPPEEFLKFLRSLWPPVPATGCGPQTCQLYPGYCAGVHEADEIRTLRQWCGYVLSGRLDLHKGLLLIGPPRSGKGTIARILTALVGKDNATAPTLASLAMNFGLQPLIGKTLAVVGDARLQQQGQEKVVERLLSITGQDGLTVDRKNRAAWFGTLGTRVMVLSNELPRFVDASGAIASRFVILKLHNSFLGSEDTRLESRLHQEFPSILKWALDGLVDLNQAGRIHEPGSHTVAMQELVDIVSPISAFLRDVCDTEPPESPFPPKMVAFQDLYAEYQQWCTENGRGAKNTAGFSADLKTQLPQLQTDYRPRVETGINKGKKMPRQVVGLTISQEWRARVRPSRYYR